MITKRIASGLLALMMTFGGAAVSAEETYSEESVSAETFEVSEDESLVTFGAAPSVYGDYEYTVSANGTVTITKYTGKDPVITVPSTINGKKVTGIGELAFYNYTSLTSITIPNSVTTISNGAFYYCASLESIAIPNSVTSIGSGAFNGCTGLTSVTIPNSVTSIGQYAFNCCESLTGIILPNSMISIESYTFYGCTSLANVTIPYSVTSIGKSAFEDCTGIKDVYYAGTEKDWGKIGFSANNGDLENATIHYNHSHTYKTTVIPPTYAAQGYTLHKCSACGSSYKDNYTAKKTVPAVTVTKYSSATNAVRINWNKVSGASGYRVYRYNTAAKKWVNAKTISGGSTVTYRDSGLKAGTNYKYKVKAYIKENGKNYWGDASSTITTATKPTTVKITKAGKTSTAVRLYWNKVDCSGYKLQQYNPSAKTWKTVKVLKSTDTNYKVSGLKKNTAYKFRIQAYKTAGSQKAYGAWSAAKTVTTKR